MRELFSEIFESMRLNKLRTALTGFSVAWGIFMLVVLLGSGNGLMNGLLSNFGSQMINSGTIIGGYTTISYNGFNRYRQVQMQNEEKNANKPREILEKIVMGKIGKYYTENCLLEQAYIKDDSMTISKFIGDNFKIARFTRWEMGEGLEKRNDDFAAEVAAQTKKQ